ncbi:MAG: sugar ABC transporter permease [SAR324 cluster bacterium]|jgi:multiple sugar transport system permease protein|uniref:ABC transmembrane type-1 domain-containing protein n=1 Tax=marine metagenome TaxID=408172 RepID=A0A381V3N7_9ZZZZ|nr:ABC transporter permease [Deltaproteobacteria bacterium]MCH2287645.1 sugar ABC transporter permease [SAR324 cluster bacterium]MCS5546958.1 sugar ABC transporter permease [SAR324 cluster bacterium]|tara:strand:+ start:1516 stop:2421 length:906 start_codon:yes stop_codon:yes gene_type:complete
MRDRHLKYLFVLPALIVVASTAIWPLLQSFYLSFREWKLNRARESKALWDFEYDGWENITYLFDNYLQAVQDDLMWNAVQVTSIFTVASVILSVGMALGLALLLAPGGKFRLTVRTMLILPFAMSPALIGVSWRFMFQPDFGLFKAFFDVLFPPLADVDWLGDPILAMIALVGSDVWHFTPFLTLVFIGGLATVPKDAQEAATIDGATSWMVFRDVTLPSILPVLAVGIVLKSIFSLKMFDQVYMLTNGGPAYATQTLAHYIYFNGFKYYDMGYASAVSYMLVIPMFGLTWVYMKLVFLKR